jgi:hypothetical protein
MDYSWVRLLTRRVIVQFLETLARSQAWNKVYIITPWMSEISEPGVPSLAQVAKRLQDEQATAYVVTRPPVDVWHENALRTFDESHRANVVLVPDLHTKLYCASTAQANFALFGSANLTQKSLRNVELGIFVNGVGHGKRLVRDLIYEAGQIYHSPSRIVRSRIRF